MDPKTLIENFADDAARRSGLPEPERTEARHELVSHLYEAARASAGDSDPTNDHVKQAIHDLGDHDAVHRAFFSQFLYAHTKSGWGRRIGAFVVDVIVLMVVSTFVLGFFVSPIDSCDDKDAEVCIILNVPGPVSIKFTNDATETDALNAFHFSFANGLHSYLSTAAFLAYFVVLEASWGRTVGKHVFAVRVLSERGPMPTYIQALGRNLTKIVLPLLLLDWLLGWAASGVKKQRVSDTLTKTLVVRQ